ncbi:autotransporter outer membrane beta-barrel domain-containing protein [Novosphingobium sp. BL-8A]|uniref:autotransporter outer membrane beta-barrel domain-containing protein n=1 Tax=Novosphingobium sp. BL-8A TaxID=3127639 RepID=UPI0037572B41
MLNATGALTLQTALGTTLASLEVSGAGSQAHIGSTIAAGTTAAGNTAISIADGGKLTTGGATTVGAAAGNANGAPTITIDGAGSDWTSQGALTMTNGDLSLTNGGTATFTAITVGSAPAAFPADILVSGAGSQLTASSGDVTLGTGSTTSTFTLRDGGAVDIAGSLVLAGATSATGILNIGGGEGEAAVAAGTLNATAVTLGSTASPVNFNHTDPLYSFDTLIGGVGVVNQVSGTTVLTANNSYTGATTISGGTLRINGDQSAATGLTSVLAGGTLGGSGIVGGDVTVADGGTIAPGNSPDTLTINGNLTLSSGSLLDYEFGQSAVVGGPLNDHIAVNGDLTLDGTIDVTVTPGGEFGAGLYRVVSYGGTLTDNGLDLGTMPAGSDVSVQTSVAGQVNLVNTGGLTLSFWDGVAGANFDGQITGGDGVWQAASGNDNWTLDDGSINAGYSDGALAIFAGTGGTVTLDGSLGTINASGIQFAADGYILTGDALTLTSAQSMVRVGDGTTVGADFIATIASTVAGNAQLVKTDLGTLILTGTNTYAGGTAINGGTLQVSSDANLGAASGGLSLNGGTLHTTASFTTSRAVALAGNGSFETDADTTLALDGLVSGAGGLTKAGDGTLTLTADNSYAGATKVAAGTLLVNGNQSAATGLTSVLAGATLGGTGTIGGNVALADGATLSPGAGGTGTLTIAGDLSLSSGSKLDFAFGSAGVAGGTLNDLVNVGGDLTLDGTIDVSASAGGTFSIGVYRVFNYDGTLTDNGLTVGTSPAGSNLTVQTSIAGQVNLVNSAGLTLNFWDGGAGGKNNDAINGGNGVWQNNTGGNDNWTDVDGSINAPYSQGSFVVFGGTAGTVTVDNSLGNVRAAGMQFTTSGYTITGDAIELTEPTTVIRVGDGSTAGASFTATIASALTGDTQVVKTDAGTLILSGANTYTGGTLIDGGTVQIAADANLGAAAGAVTLDGGTLATSANLASNREIQLAGAGSISAANATTFTLNGTVTGTGALTKAGLGTLVLTGDNSDYTGAATVAAGTLAVDGRLGGTLAVAAEGRLEGTGHVGSVTNAGTIAPGRDGFGTLTVDGDYTGAGGKLLIETELGGDTSRTDVLSVSGATSGNTTVSVVNRGGLGAATVNGIKIIDIAGASNGTFTLAGDYTFQGDQAVIAGAYGYRLVQNGVDTPTDGDWYLRSSLLDAGTSPEVPNVPLYQPGVPVYEAYGQTLLTLNELGTMRQRIGDRQSAIGTDGQPSSIWGRMEGQRSRPNATASTSLSDVNVDSWKMELGADHVISQRSDGAALILGVVGGYGQASAKVMSIFGDGSIKTKGYSLGATLTWFGPQGFYVDGRTQFTWFDSTLKSATLGTLAKGNDGNGQAYSLELGKQWSLGGRLSLTPQVQMVYSTVDFDRFVDPYGASVSSKLGDSLKTRWGLSLDRQDATSKVYAVASLSYEWLDGTVADVSDTAIARQNDRLWGELGLGANVMLGNGLTLYAEASGKTATHDFGDSYALKANAGLRLAF